MFSAQGRVSKKEERKTRKEKERGKKDSSPLKERLSSFKF